MWKKNEHFYLFFANTMLVIRAGSHIMLLKIANREDPDLSLHYLSMPFWQAISVRNCSGTFTILGLWVLGIAVSHINESNCKHESRTLFLMTSLQYYCILGLAKIKTLHPRDKIIRKRCRMRR